jgi:hypothetical protein
MNTSPNILPDEGFQGQIDADGRRPGYERSSRLRVAEQDQYHGIELKPVVMRRLRVIDVREHGGPGLPQPGLKVIGGLRHRMLARPCHEPIIRGAGGKDGERHRQSRKDNLTSVHALSFVILRTLPLRSTPQGALFQPSKSGFRAS